ncbi:hypothetical protein EDB19DRAFT_577247 [Suillus lakei]|nr:hypothetical protein EDB19DRAFT_577247 [Suillus lakei]
MTILRINEVLLLLRLCPNLSSLTTCIASNNEGQALVPFTHTKLQSFYASPITVCSHDIYSILYHSPICACSRLVIYGHGLMRSSRHLARSNCPLETLSFGGRGPVTDEERAEYIGLIPSVGIVVNSTPPIRVYLI